MQLFEKQANGRYKPYIPKPINMPEIEQNQVITLLCALTISMLMSVEEQLPPKSANRTRIVSVEDAVKKLAALNGEKLDPDLVDIGVGAWNAAIHSMQTGLSGGATC